MTSWSTIGAIVVLLGIVLASPAIVFIGAAVLVIRVLAEVWPRRVLDQLEYRRSVSPDRTIAGDEVELRMTLWNRTRSPLAWASATDTLSEGLMARTLSGSEVGGFGQDVLRVSGALRPYEQVTRRFKVTPLRRGVHELGPARVRVAELFGTHAPLRDPELEPLTILARPRTAPVTGAVPANAPLARRRAPRSLFADPHLFAGVRPFQPGDPLKSVHWRASARRPSLQTKRFEPSLSGQVVLVFDVQTIEGEYWMLVYDDIAFEALATATLSIARELVTAETAVGFAAAAFSGTTSRYVHLPARADRPQLSRLGDALARLSPESSAPLANLLSWLPRRLASGSMIVVLSARDATQSRNIVRSLERSGYPVHFLLHGPQTLASEARRAGMSAWSLRVDTEGGVPRAVAIAA
ncbi:hypothetical protein BH24CHL5_BH24CHL5_11030 [soil metagenome]